VTYACTDPGDGSSFTATGTVSSWSSTAVSATIPSSGSDFTSGAVCLVQVTNADGTWFVYSAVSITNPAANLYGWSAGPDLLVARRAPAAVAARATLTSRTLYAIGGDDGSSAGALSSIERAKVDRYGGVGAWEELPTGLPAPRTLATVARVGRYLYLVGGNDGSGPVATTLRAQVLDPLEAPSIVDVDVEYGTGKELGGGTWVYRVAAIFPSTYDDNPGGESLASDPFVVRLPDVPDTLRVTLSWDAVPEASGYRIYR
jgi:hypothetical protein